MTDQAEAGAADAQADKPAADPIAVLTKRLDVLERELHRHLSLRLADAEAALDAERAAGTVNPNGERSV